MTATARNLCLHFVTARSGERRLAVSEDALRALLERELAARRAATLDDYLTGTPGPNAFTVSFDDAHVSVLERAAPILAKLGVRGALFVPVAWVSTTDEWLTWDGLRALRDLGWTIGAHATTHPRMPWRLYDETSDAYALRLREECERARDAIGRELGAAPRLFAYPYGEDPPAAREAVREAGYAAAFTVRDGAEWDGDRLSIPRVDGMEASGLVTPAPGEPLGISVVVPAKDRAPILHEVLFRLAAQSYPAERHEVIVVDDGSREDLRAVMPDDPRFRLVKSDDGSGLFRAGQARNVGARAARHTHLAFLDADVAVPRDYLWALDWVHRRWERAAILGYLSGYNLHDLGHVHTLAQVRGREPLERTPVIPDRQRDPVARACLDNVEWTAAPWKLCYTGNLSVPRALFDEVGGFADDFRGWGLEDVDLGVRLHRAGARFVFSRFALGYHLVDTDEPAPRNPFRRATPTRDDFAGYLENVAVLRAHHAGDHALEEFVARTLADVEETCSRPHTVGIEFGGASSVRPPGHATLHRMQPGGVPTDELLDRVAYAVKVGARRLWLQGGEPAEHDGFLRVLEAAHRAGLRTGMLTTAHPFADARLARAARSLGLDHATLLVFGTDEQSHDALCGPGTWARFDAGRAALTGAGVHTDERPP